MLGNLAKIRDLGPLLLRVAVGLVAIYHGHPKLFGGMDRFEQTVASLGMPGWMAWPAALSEFAGGIFLVLGLMTRWAALAFAATMAVAAFRVHGGDGFGEYEFPMVLMVASLSLVLSGGGWLSFDRNIVKKEF